MGIVTLYECDTCKMTHRDLKNTGRSLCYSCGIHVCAGCKDTFDTKSYCKTCHDEVYDSHYSRAKDFYQICKKLNCYKFDDSYILFKYKKADEFWNRKTEDSKNMYHLYVRNERCYFSSGHGGWRDKTLETPVGWFFGSKSCGIGFEQEVVNVLIPRTLEMKLWFKESS